MHGGANLLATQSVAAVSTAHPLWLLPNYFAWASGQNPMCMLPNGAGSIMVVCADAEARLFALDRLTLWQKYSMRGVC
jgi:hypothetical protein